MGESAGIPIFRPVLGTDELEALKQVFASGWIGPGPKSERFEAKFADFVGSRFAVSVTSCSAALHLACLALGISPGDEVLVPSLSFISTAHAPSYCGATVVFVDVEPKQYGMDIDDLRAKISSRSKAIIPVHYAGHPCAMDEIWDIAEEHNLYVIEDAAHACSAEYRGERVGGLERTHATCFSFNAVKNLCTGDGGMVTTGSRLLARKIRELRWMGIQKSTFERSVREPDPLVKAEEYRWFYEVDDLGYKYVMNDIAATLGLVQLAKIEATQRRREEMAQLYSDAFSELRWLKLPSVRGDVRSAWHLFPLRLENRDALADFLKERRITTGVHYFPLHLQPYYRKRRKRWSRGLAVTDRLWKELLTIPFHPGLRSEELQRVIEAILDFGRTLPRRG